MEARLVEEAALRLTIAENDVLVAKAEVALAEARKKQVEVAFERERLQKLIDQLKAVARQQDRPRDHCRRASRQEALAVRNLEVDSRCRRR